MILVRYPEQKFFAFPLLQYVILKFWAFFILVCLQKGLLKNGCKESIFRRPLILLGRLKPWYGIIQQSPKCAHRIDPRKKDQERAVYYNTEYTVN